jgi:3-oxoacyl-[acyl-carrier protein] reductase
MIVMSVVGITDRVLPGMRAARWGRVITSTSSGVVAPIPNLGISNALRSALVGWSKTLAREVARDGITANIVLPGRVATDRIRFLDEQKAEREGRPADEVAAESTASIPVGRYGRPEEYGDAVAFLASARASYITGSIIRVDGGLIGQRARLLHHRFGMRVLYSDLASLPLELEQEEEYFADWRAMCRTARSCRCTCRAAR